MLPSESPEMQLLYESHVENKIVSLVEEYRSSHHDRYYGSNNMWRFLNRKLFESYRINIDTRSFFTKMKKDVVKSVEMYEDQEKAADALFRLVKNYLPIFDIMPPRSVMVHDILNKDKRFLRNRSAKTKSKLNLRESTSQRKDRSKARASHRRKTEKVNYKTDNKLAHQSSVSEVKSTNLESLKTVEKPSCSVPSCSYTSASHSEESPQESDFVRYKLKRMKMIQSQSSNINKVASSPTSDVPVNEVAHTSPNNPVSVPSSGSVIASASKTATIKPYSSSLTPSTPSSIYAGGENKFKNSIMATHKNVSHSNEVPTPNFLPPSFYQNFNAARSRNSGNSDDTPPEWFQSLFNDYKANEIWKLRELFQMERTFMDIECRKLNALEKISETLKRKP